MANRHSHKKRRAEIRSRMASTGESYQAALRQVLALRRDEQRGERTSGPDLIVASYFGVPITVAAFEVLSHLRLVLVSGASGLIGLPWSSPSPIRVHTDGVQ